MRRPRKAVSTPKDAQACRHPDADLPTRPEIGAQAHFKQAKRPTPYRFDSSLAPSLEWDGQNPAHETAEHLIVQLSDLGLRLPNASGGPAGRRDLNHRSFARRIVCCEILLMKNSCLEEIWAARRLIARQTGFSLRRTVEYLRGLEADYPGWVVSFQPRPPDAVWLEPLPRVRAAPRAARASRRLARGTAAASLQARPKSLTPPIARA